MTEHPADYSLLLSLLGIGVMLMAAQVAAAWVRLAHRSSRSRLHWRALAMAAGALGTGVSASAVLTLSAEGLTYTLGFEPLRALGLWLLAMAGCLPAVALLAMKSRSALLLASGVVLALVVVAGQMGWVAAAGLVPGVVWRWKQVGLAGLVLVAGISSAWWMSASAAAHSGLRRTLMRNGAKVLLGVVVVIGQEALVWAARLQDQTRAEHAYDLNTAPLSLFCGVLVPLVLAMLALEVRLRGERRNRREARDDFTASPRRRRRKSRVEPDLPTIGG